MKALEIQELMDRIKTRKKLRVFYVSLQGILKSAGCISKVNNIVLDPEEQKQAEEIWAKINQGLNEIQELIEHYQGKDTLKIREDKSWVA